MSQENTTIPLPEKQLRDVNKSISNLVKAIEQGIFTRAIKERMDELEASRIRKSSTGAGYSCFACIASISLQL